MVEPIRRGPRSCVWCHRRPALASIRETWPLVVRHDVCRQCWRSFTDAYAAGRLRLRRLPA